MDEGEKEAGPTDDAEGAHSQIAPSVSRIDPAAIVGWRRHGGATPRATERASRSSRWLVRPRIVGTGAI